MLKLGYKASAEQFGSGAALEFAQHRRRGRFRFRLHQRSFPALAPHRRPRAVLARMAWRARCIDIAHRDRHQRAHAHLPLSSVHRGPGLRHARASMFPGRVILGRRHGRVAERSAGDRMSNGRNSRSVSRGCAKRVTLIRKLWSEDRVTFEGEFYQTENATIYDRPDTPVPIYVAAAGAMVAKYAGRTARRLHLHQRQEARALYARRCCRSLQEGALVGHKAMPPRSTG